MPDADGYFTETEAATHVGPPCPQCGMPTEPVWAEINRLGVEGPRYFPGVYRRPCGHLAINDVKD